ncbi:MAG: hypothetical protein ACOC9T_02970, partial [Myxococcota bacterium]
MLREQVDETGFPQSDVDRVLVARLWRRAGETVLAHRSLEAVTAGGNAADLSAYETARLWLEAGNVGRGARAYWHACSATDDAARAEIAWDLMAVSTPEERSQWDTLRPGAATCEWLRRFWAERARLMAISRDERLAVHFQRLAHARDQYWIPRPRFMESMADRHGRPAGLAIDDRGLIYVRMGPPLTSGNFGSTGDAVEGFDAATLSTCWPYLRASGYRIYCFAQGAGRADGDYRLLQGIGGVPGDGFFQKYVVNSDLPQNIKAGLVRGRGLAARSAVRDESEREMDAVEAGRYDRGVVLATRRFADEALKSIPDAPAIRSTAALRFEALRFLNRQSGRWQVWLLASVRAGDLSRSSDGESRTVDAGGRFAVLVSDRLVVDSFPSVSLEAGAIPPGSGLGLLGVLEAESGPLPFTVVVEDLNAPGAGNWHQDTINVPSIGGLPQLSDIAVAQAEGGTWTRDGETFLKVTPAHITNPDGSIHTYFEVYGVDPGTRYDVELRLAPTEAAERIWRLEPDDLGFRLQF